MCQSASSPAAIHRDANKCPHEFPATAPVSHQTEVGRRGGRGGEEWQGGGRREGIVRGMGRKGKGGWRGEKLGTGQEGGKICQGAGEGTAQQGKGGRGESMAISSVFMGSAFDGFSIGLVAG